MDLFADFRFGGYRILGDIICDFDDMYRAGESREHLLHRTDDSALLSDLMREYESGRSRDHKAWIVKRCRQYIAREMNFDEALMCAVALGKRNFAFEVLTDHIEPNAVKGRKR